jgi:hypothetical protein
MKLIIEKSDLNEELELKYLEDFSFKYYKLPFEIDSCDVIRFWKDGDVMIAHPDFSFETIKQRYILGYIENRNFVKFSMLIERNDKLLLFSI